MATATTALVLLVVGVVVVTVFQARLLANLDGSVEHRADQIEALVLAGDAGALAIRNSVDRFAQVLDGEEGRSGPRRTSRDCRSTRRPPTGAVSSGGR